METSLSMVTSNYHCLKLYPVANATQRCPSVWSGQARAQLNRQNNSGTHENHVTLVDKLRFLPTSSGVNHRPNSRVFALSPTKGILASSTSSVPTKDDCLVKGTARSSSLPGKDENGRFNSPRAARELALAVIYASCLEGCDPVRLFDRRLNAPRERGYNFDKASLLRYNHMSFSEPPTRTETLEEADKLLRDQEAETVIEAEVLSAPPKLVYNKYMLRLSRKMVIAVREKWNDHVAIIDKIVPVNWKNEPVGRILEVSILHLAMSEISVLGSGHPIAINEAVHLAKRFCDGAAPRVINGCLRSFIKLLEVRSEKMARNQKKITIL
ncbi:hypothetical protein Droror1_Dr00010184 [Drosera rotundifolia]